MATQLELDSLFVMIKANADHFDKVMGDVGKSLTAMEQRVKSFASSVESVVEKVNANVTIGIDKDSIMRANSTINSFVALTKQKLASIPPVTINLAMSGGAATPDLTNVAGLISNLNRMYPDLIGLKPILEALPNMEPLKTWLGSFKGFPTMAEIPNLSPIASSLARIGQFVKAIDKADLAKIGESIRPLKNFVVSFAEMSNLQTVKDNTPQLKQISLSLQRISMLARSITKIDPKEFSTQTEAFVSGVNKMITDLATASTAAKAIDPLIASLHKIATFIRSIPKMESAKLGPVGKSLKDFVADLVMASIATTTIDPLIASLSKVANFIRFIPKMEPAGLGAVGTGLKSFVADLVMASAATGVIDTLMASLSKVTSFIRFIPKMQPAGLGAVGTGLKGFVADLVMASAASTTIDTLMGSLRNVASFIRFIPKMQPAGLGAVGTGLKGFVADLVMASAASTTIDTLMGSLTKVASFIRFIPKMLPAGLGAVGTAISGFVTTLVTSAASVGAINPLIASLRSVATFIRGIPKLGTSVTGLSAIGSALASFASGLASIPPANVANITSVARAMGALGSLNKLAAVNMSQVVTNGNKLIAWLKTFNFVSPNTLNIVTQLGRGLSGFARFLTATGSAGGRLPPIMNNITNSIAGMAPTAASSSRGLFGLGNLFRDMTTSATAASGSLTSLKMTMTGLMGFSIYFFGKFDEALTRVLVHMREWPDKVTHALTRETLQKGMIEISATSITGVVELAHGLDFLASRGMSASMAVKALAIAESFAVASGMEMAEATRHLVDLQFMLGKSSENVEEHYKNMTRMSDVFIGMAPMVGSTTKQLTEAFGERFVSAMKMSNMSFEEGIALMGVYSERGIRGSEASDRAARALMSFSRMNIEHLARWRALNVNVYDSNLKMRKIPDIIDDISKALGLGGMAAYSKLMWMGFDQRVVSAIVPLLGASNRMRQLGKEMEDVDGITRRAADMMRDNLGFQLKIIYNNLVVAANAVGEFFAPAVHLLAKSLESLTMWVLKLNPAYRHLLTITTALVLALGPLTMLLSFLGGVIIKTMISSFMVLASVITVPFRLLMAVLGTVLSTLRSVMNALISVGRAVGTVVGAVFSTIYTVMVEVVSITWRWVRTLAMLPIRVVVALYNAFRALLSPLVAVLSFITGIGWHFWNFVKTLASLGTGIAAFAARIAASITLMAIEFGLFLTGLIISAMALIPLLFLVAAGIAAISAAIGSIAITTILASLTILKAIAVGAMVVWGAISVAATATFVAIKAGMVWLGGAIGEVWANFKAGAGAAFESVINFLPTLAGFFWNFGENVVVIWEFIRVHWRAVLVDMGNVVSTFLKNMISNIQTVFGTIWNLGSMIWRRLSDTFMNYFDLAYGWLAEHWRDILDDMTTIFKAFISTLIENFVILFRLLGPIIDNELAIILAPYKKLFLIAGKFNPALGIIGKGIPDPKPLDYNKMLEDAFKGMKNPFDKLDPSKFKTNIFGVGAGKDFIPGLWGLFSDLNKETRASWAKLGTDLFGELGKGLDKLLGPLAGFAPTAPFADMFKRFKTVLPPDAGDKITEWLKGLFKPFAEPEGGAVMGKGAAGYAFKQISQERYMVGGQAAETLDYQQLVTQRITADNTTRMVKILEALFKAGAPVPKPAMGPLI